MNRDRGGTGGARVARGAVRVARRGRCQGGRLAQKRELRGWGGQGCAATG